MSTATTVPQTYELEGDDALRALRSTGLRRLAIDSFLRFRAADGFSHARALAFQVVLTLVPFLIAFVGFATMLRQQRLSDALRRAIEEVAPGPAGQIVTQAFEQGKDAVGGRGGTTALLFGAVATLISATYAMAQVERGANRIYGLQSDRPTMARYRTAFVLACSAGVMMLVAFGVLVMSETFVEALQPGRRAAGDIWEFIRWPLGIVLSIGAFALLFERAPRRRQPQLSWLAYGSALSIALWLLLTGLLAVWLGASDGLGQTYGALAGLIGLLLWAFLTGVALFLGLAFAAQLEAVRAGVRQPRIDVPEELGSPLRPAARHAGAEPQLR
jgi:YihY family inner membrane protein